MAVRSNHKEQIGILISFVIILLFFALLPTTFYYSPNENLVGKAYGGIINKFNVSFFNHMNEEKDNKTTETEQKEVMQKHANEEALNKEDDYKDREEDIENERYFLLGMQQEQTFFKEDNIENYGIIFEESQTTGGISLDFDEDGDKDFITYGDTFNYLFLNNIDKNKFNNEEYKRELLDGGTDIEPMFIQLNIFNEPELSNQHTKIIIAEDFNNDGLTDFFVGNYGGDSYVYYAINKINYETIQSKIKNKQDFDDFKENFRKYPIFSDKYILSAVVFDINNDGKKDIIVANYNQPNEIYLNQGEEFKKQEHQTLDLKLNGDYSYDVNIDDVNRDGKNDIIFGTNKGVYIFFNQDGKFNTDDFYKINIANVRKINLIDIDGDGKKDMVVSVYSGKDLIYLKTKNEGFYELVDVSNEKNTMESFKFGNKLIKIVYNDVPYISTFNLGEMISFNASLLFSPLNIEKGFFNSGLSDDFNDDGVFDLMLFSNKKDKLIFGPIE